MEQLYKIITWSLKMIGVLCLEEGWNFPISIGVSMQGGFLKQPDILKFTKYMLTKVF